MEDHRRPANLWGFLRHITHVVNPFPLCLLYTSLVSRSTVYLLQTEMFQCGQRSSVLEFLGRPFSLSPLRTLLLCASHPAEASVRAVVEYVTAPAVSRICASSNLPDPTKCVMKILIWSWYCWVTFLQIPAVKSSVCYRESIVCVHCTTLLCRACFTSVMLYFCRLHSKHCIEWL